MVHRTIFIANNNIINDTRNISYSRRKKTVTNNILSSSKYNFIHTTSPASKRDHYDVLGVPKSASQSEIKNAYYKHAKKLHPDVNKEPGATEKFAELQDAYDTLSDTEKRQEYDSFGHGGNPFGGGGNPFGGGGGGFHGNVNAEDIFSNLNDIFGGGSPFGGGGGRRHNPNAPQRRPPRGPPPGSESSPRERRTL